MPNLYSDKSGCCGCGACVAVCPKRCITMVRDEEGFDYPVIDLGKCIRCGKCEAVCPWKHEPDLEDRQTPPDVHAAWSLDEEIRRQSSSGGVFSALAKHILAQGGAVVGAAFTDDFHAVEHVIVENEEGLARLRGSKYVQSEIPPALFHAVAEMITRERPVLFSGCPCQVAGLRLYLGENQKTLFTCDLVCHGVPSPGWFDRYCKQMEAENQSELASLSFRSKDFGWKDIHTKYTYGNRRVVVKKGSEDYYYSTFVNNYSTRHSCFSCKYASPLRQGDLTLGDYWGVASMYPEYDQANKGTSFVMLNTQKGRCLLDACAVSLAVGEGDFEQASLNNGNLKKPSSPNIKHGCFMCDCLFLTYERLIAKYRPSRISFCRKYMRKLVTAIKMAMSELNVR